MDSMRSLNTSLPKASRPRPAAPPDVHQSFKSAALTVTNLYKAALADIDNARADGYQQALEELLGFLDKEHMGQAEGEGSRIRQWATERFDGPLPAALSSDSDEESLEEKRARSSSPVMDANQGPDHIRLSEPPQADAAQRSDSAPPTQTNAQMADTDMTPQPPAFTFSSPQGYPPNLVESPLPDLSIAARRAFPSARRPSHRNSSRNLQRSAAANLFPLGSGAGQKRKIMNEFFNVDSINDRRDGSGGNKRGRMS